MFTGLIDAVGKLDRVSATGAGRELRVKCEYDDLAPGESVAVNGACLTVRECGKGWFTAAAAETTLERTAIGAWTPGLRVNLERAVRVGDRLGGHMVQGHVDGVGRVLDARNDGDVWLVDVTVPRAVAELLVPQGSVTVDGVSLTVNALRAPDVLQVAVVDFTRRNTTLGALSPGMPVHLETDIVGKYVQRLLTPYRPGTG